MIAINQHEREIIGEKFPAVHIVRTMKQKSKRGRYYMEETPAAMRFLKTLRGSDRKGV